MVEGLKTGHYLNNFLSGSSPLSQMFLSARICLVKVSCFSGKSKSLRCLLVSKAIALKKSRIWGSLSFLPHIDDSNERNPAQDFSHFLREILKEGCFKDASIKVLNCAFLCLNLNFCITLPMRGLCKR